MLSPKRPTRSFLQEKDQQQGFVWEWRSFKWMGEALFILTVPGGLVLWLGREVWKRGMTPTGSGWLWIGSNWIHRRLAWVSNPDQKIIR